MLIKLTHCFRLLAWSHFASCCAMRAPILVSSARRRLLRRRLLVPAPVHAVRREPTGPHSSRSCAKLLPPALSGFEFARRAICCCCNRLRRSSSARRSCSCFCRRRSCSRFCLRARRFARRAIRRASLRAHCRRHRRRCAHARKRSAAYCLPRLHQPASVEPPATISHALSRWVRLLLSLLLASPSL